MGRPQFLLSIIFGILLAGCSNTATEVTVNQTYEIPDFGFSIEYPEGWFIDTDQTITWIREDEADFDLRYIQERKLDGIGITLDHRTLEWLTQVYGLEEYPTLNDLFQLNIEEISHMVSPEIIEVNIFGVNALNSEFYGEQDQYYSTYAGYLDDEAFLFSYSAPNQQEFDDFKSSWQLILASITKITQ
jgi:hypothetical protein